jgi:hypothetical protein
MNTYPYSSGPPVLARAMPVKSKSRLRDINSAVKVLFMEFLLPYRKHTS